MASSTIIPSTTISIHPEHPGLGYAIERLADATHFAAHKHRNQKRKNYAKTPYINHPIEVAAILARAGVEVPAIIAGVLHDTLEDTQTTYEELVEDFGLVVASIVKECTDDKSLPKVERKKAQIDHASKISDQAKVVKLADKLSNLSTLDSDPPSGWSRGMIDGYFLWCYMVCSEMKTTSVYIENLLWIIFKKHGFMIMTERQLQNGLKEYYDAIELNEILLGRKI